MENQEELRTVGGLADVAAVARYCGVKPAQIRLWAWRKQNTEDPLPALFPDPIGVDDAGAPGGKVNGGNVWDAGAVVAFKAALDSHASRGGRTPARLKGQP